MHTRIYIAFCFFLVLFSSHAQNGLKKGEIAPDFTVLDPNGKELKLSDLRGKLVLLDFWASWCLPCRMASPELVEAYAEYQKEGFEIFSISFDVKKDAWVKAIQNDSLYWPYHGSDLKGWENSVGILYKVEMIPATYLISEDGIILENHFDIYSLSKRLKYVYHEQVHMFPSYVNDTLHFSAPTKFAIEDSSGKVILKGKDQKIFLGNLALGTYTCKYDRKAERVTVIPTSDEAITFYPTKVISDVTLSRKTSYDVVNGKGKIVLSGEGELIDMKYLPTGAYKLILEGKTYKIFKK